ncbi:hypothetical protein C8F04DRAFT_1231841 [Mycena alexandri]|uniref:Uncharacterized protein n=1 Tax=Mycena alexandri TaxID=1745969 RepID=A0AAD6T6H4_9AGAR|nr:hypothetical protein C8F04DRAFT_1231841 [Mycena alexandri]
MNLRWWNPESTNSIIATTSIFHLPSCLPPHTSTALKYMESVAFDSSWHFLVLEVSLAGVEIFLYMFQGLTTALPIFLNLFIFAIYTLACRKAPKRILLVFAWIMAVLGTTQTALRLVTAAVSLRAIRGSLDQDTSPASVATVSLLGLTQEALFGINNLVSDALLLHRCYRIWGCRRKVLVVPGILMVSTFAVGCAGVFSNVDFRAGYGLGAFTNLVLTVLTGTDSLGLPLGLKFNSWSHMMDSARCIARLAGRNNPGSLQYGDGNDPRVWGAVPHSRNMRGHHLLT